MLQAPSDEEPDTPASPFPPPETPLFTEDPASPPSHVSTPDTIWYDSDVACTELERP